MSRDDLPTLGLFAKWPRPGDVKTRLAAATSPEWAARVALAFLQDTLDRLVTVEARRGVAHTPLAAQVDFARLGGGRLRLDPSAHWNPGETPAAFGTLARAAGAR